MNLLELQSALAALGYAIACDGRYGPATRAAVLSALTDPVESVLTAADVGRVAAQWIVDPAALWAFRDVEASGAGFEDGRPKILFEPHRFSRATGHRFDAAHPDVSYPTWDRHRYPGSQAGRYAQLLDAIALDVDAAFASASYGAFQLLGENWRTCGANSPFGFALTEATGEAAQFDHFTRFCAGSGIVPLLQAKDFDGVAARYNGTAWRVNDYGGRLRRAYWKRGGI